MQLQQYLNENPLPPGTTRWGMPAPEMDALQRCSFDVAEQLGAMLTTAMSAAGLTPAPGYPAPAIVDGGGTGTGAVNADVLAVPPVQPFTPGQFGFFAFYGFVQNSAGQVMLIDESLGELQARGLVNQQGTPAGALGGEIDKNFVVTQSGVREAVYTTLAFEVGGGVAQAYWVAP
jgi:hypothetical protein